jgi:hypothetical protein
MRQFIIIGALLVSAITGHAQQQQYSPIDSFFQANYNVPNLARYANRQVGQVSYVLINVDEYLNVQQRYFDGGYVKLGTSAWESKNGVPDREDAISYARFIGADAVIYAVTSHFDYNRQVERTDHTVGFYARASAGSARVLLAQPAQGTSLDTIEQAEKTLQQVWDRMPRAKKNALRADEYAYINRIYSLRKTDPDRYLALIKERTAFIAAQ